MTKALHAIVIDLGVSITLTSGLAAFWLLHIDAAPDDVATLMQRAAKDQRANAYVESVLKEAHLPSHGQLIVAQATVSEIMNREHDAASESPTGHSVPWRAFTPLLAVHVLMTFTMALLMRQLRRSRKA